MDSLTKIRPTGQTATECVIRASSVLGFLDLKFKDCRALVATENTTPGFDIDMDKSFVDCVVDMNSDPIKGDMHAVIQGDKRKFRLCGRRCARFGQRFTKFNILPGVERIHPCVSLTPEFIAALDNSEHTIGRTIQV